MLKKFIKDYLTFSRRDRVGAITLLVLVLVVAFLPAVWPSPKEELPGKAELDELRRAVALLTPQAAPSAESTDRNKYYAEAKGPPLKPALCYFDPNTIDSAGWMQLGLPQKTASTIRKYIAKGGAFHRAQDLQKIYSLRSADYDRLLPFVKIGEKRSFNQHAAVRQSTDSGTTVRARPPENEMTGRFKATTAKAMVPVDINTADTTAFIALRGIGPALASRIIRFREKLGGFYSIEQVGETFGLPDATFQSIRPLLRCSHPNLRTINLNTADENILKQHPYIRWQLANLLLQYRLQHGPFHAVDDLLKVEGITASLLEKLRAYVVVD